jgi:hypothetical protein
MQIRCCGASKYNWPGCVGAASDLPIIDLNQSVFIELESNRDEILVVQSFEDPVLFRSELVGFVFRRFGARRAGGRGSPTRSNFL